MVLVFLLDHLRVPGNLTFLDPCSLCYPLWAPSFHRQQTSAGPRAAPAQTHSAYRAWGEQEAPTSPSWLFAGRPRTGHPQDSLAWGTPAHKAGAEKQGSLCRGRFQYPPGFNSFPCDGNLG